MIGIVLIWNSYDRQTKLLFYGLPKLPKLPFLWSVKKVKKISFFIDSKNSKNSLFYGVKENKIIRRIGLIIYFLLWQKTAKDAARN